MLVLKFSASWIEVEPLNDLKIGHSTSKFANNHNNIVNNIVNKYDIQVFDYAIQRVLKFYTFRKFLLITASSIKAHFLKCLINSFSIFIYFSVRGLYYIY